MGSVCNQSVLSFSCRISHVMATTERACESAWESSAYDVESVRTWHASEESECVIPPPQTQRKHPDNDQWQPTSQSLDSSWRAKSIEDYGWKVIQFNARLDPVLARMEPVFARGSVKEPTTRSSVKGKLSAVTKISVLRLDWNDFTFSRSQATLARREQIPPHGKKNIDAPLLLPIKKLYPSQPLVMKF